MKLAPFLLDQWLKQAHSADSQVEFDLGSSTGPAWTLRELVALGGDVEHLLNEKLFYEPAAGSDELRAELALMHGVGREHVIVTTGAAEALLILFHLAAEPGANIVLPHPGFPMNEAVAGSMGLEIRRYHLRAEGEFKIDHDELHGLVDQNTKFVLVNSPHNPSGAVIGEEEMDQLYVFCMSRGVQLICDEVYHPIYHGEHMRSAARLPGVTVVSDFSKALCLSGLRIGWMIEQNARRREQYINARSYFTVSSSVLSERLGSLAIRNRETIYDHARKIAQKNLALLDDFFAEQQEEIECVRPAGGMTAFPALRSGADAREFCETLARQGVLVVPGDCFGMPAHFRIGFAASGDRFPRAIERLETILRAAPR